MNRKRRNYFRLGLQGTIIALLAYMLIRLFADKSYQPDFEAYCPIGGLQAFSTWLVSNTLACSMNTQQIAMGLALVLGIILFSKLFCAYVCPIGIFTEWLGKLSARRKLLFTLTGISDRLLRLLKYILLFLTFYFTLQSSELFCRKFDPYYAVFTGFGGDVVVWMAIAALAIVVLGSFFIRQFWCKYLCPLGAASNIFAFTLPFMGITLIYAVFELYTDIPQAWVWYLGALCLAGFLMESLYRTTYIFPLMKVYRNPDLCTNCKICDKACPYGINVSVPLRVDHIDCNLCGDCVTKCPEKGALTYNKRQWKWLPAVATVVLIVAAILFASYTEIPTISEKWGTPEQMDQASVLKMSGLKNIKCFGSSRAFSNHMKDIPGVLGVSTYVKHHEVKVYFDPSVITGEGVKAAIFSPVKEIFALPSKEVEQVGLAEAGIDHFFDPNDEYFLTQIFQQKPGIFAFETEFGEPVKARIFYDKSKFSMQNIKDLIESKFVELGEGNDKVRQKIDFRVASISEKSTNLTTSDFIAGLFTPFEKTFNGYETIDSTKLLIYQIPFPDCLFSDKKDRVAYLRNHMSADKGLFRFTTMLYEAQPVLRIYYLPDKTNPEAIYSLLTKKKLHVTYKDNTTEEFDNPFNFPSPGKTIP